MKEFLERLQTHIEQRTPDLGDADSVLTLLYEAYSDCNRMDDAVIKEDFHRLYEQMNGLTLRDMDRILDPVCTLCRSHERCGFVEGVKVGVRLIQELNHT